MNNTRRVDVGMVLLTIGSENSFLSRSLILCLFGVGSLFPMVPMDDDVPPLRGDYNYSIHFLQFIILVYRDHIHL